MSWNLLQTKVAETKHEIFRLSPVVPTARRQKSELPLLLCQHLFSQGENQQTVDVFFHNWTCVTCLYLMAFNPSPLFILKKEKSFPCFPSAVWRKKVWWSRAQQSKKQRPDEETGHPIYTGTAVRSNTTTVCLSVLVCVVLQWFVSLQQPLLYNSVFKCKILGDNVTES